MQEIDDYIAEDGGKTTSGHSSAVQSDVTLGPDSIPSGTGVTPSLKSSRKTSAALCKYSTENIPNVM